MYDTRRTSKRCLWYGLPLQRKKLPESYAYHSSRAPCLFTRKKEPNGSIYHEIYVVNTKENPHLDSEPQRGNKSLELVVLIDLLRRAPLDVKDLASKRKDRLLNNNVCFCC